MIIQEPENDYRFGFSGGVAIVSEPRIVHPEKHIVISSKKHFKGVGLPNCFLDNPRIRIAEIILNRDDSCYLVPGMVFRDAEDQLNVFIFAGLARPTGNDSFVFFLGGVLSVSELFWNDYLISDVGEWLRGIKIV